MKYIIRNTILVCSWYAGHIDIVYPNYQQNKQKYKYYKRQKAVSFFTGVLNFRHN